MQHSRYLHKPHWHAARLRPLLQSALVRAESHPFSFVPMEPKAPFTLCTSLQEQAAGLWDRSSSPAATPKKLEQLCNIGA